MIIPTYSQFRVNFAIPAAPLDPDGYPRWPVEKVREPGSGFGDSGTTLEKIPRPPPTFQGFFITCNGYAPDSSPFFDEYKWFFEARTETELNFPVRVVSPDVFDSLHFGLFVGLGGGYRTLTGGTSLDSIGLDNDIGWTGVAQPTVTKAWAVGGNASIASSTDGGATWSPQVSPILGVDLHEVYFLDELLGYAVGEWDGVGDLTVIRTTDGGATWANVPGIAAAAGSNGLLAVNFFNPDRGIVAGVEDSLYFTIDGGATWAAGAGIASPFNISDVEFSPVPSSPINFPAFACDLEGRIHLSVNGGANWNTLFTGPNALTAMSVIDVATAWACGFNGTVLKTIDGGATWVAQDTGGQEGFFGIRFISHTRGWACSSSGAVIVTDNGGDTWGDVPYSGPPAKFLCTDGPRVDMSQITFSGTVLVLPVNQGTGGASASMSPEDVVSVFKNTHLYVQRISDQATQWVDLLRAMVANTG